MLKRTIFYFFLFIILGIILYIVYPKWVFYPKFRIKFNKITGQIYQYDNGSWRLVGKKSKSLLYKQQKTLNLKDDLGILNSDTKLKNE